MSWQNRITASPCMLSPQYPLGMSAHPRIHTSEQAVSPTLPALLHIMLDKSLINDQKINIQGREISCKINKRKKAHLTYLYCCKFSFFDTFACCRDIKIAIWTFYVSSNSLFKKPNLMAVYVVWLMHFVEKKSSITMPIMSGSFHAYNILLVIH